MRKFLVIAIPIAVLSVFVIIMNSWILLKKPINGEDDINGLLYSLMESVRNNGWEAAENKSAELEKAWSRVVKRVQFSVEQNEITYFSSNLARLRGAIMARDKAGALMELNEAHRHFNDLGR